jgi:hypothetical protein
VRARFESFSEARFHTTFGELGLGGRLTTVRAVPSLAAIQVQSGPMVEISPRQVGALKDAVVAAGATERLGLPPQQFDEYIHALAWFMGGSLDSVEAFVAQVPGTVTEMSGGDANQHRVYWLRGNAIGSLAVGEAKSDEGPLELSGYVRPVSDIRRLDFRGAQFYWPPHGGPPEVRPEVVRIHFDDLAIAVTVAGRPDQTARDQALSFIDSLQRAMAGDAWAST